MSRSEVLTLIATSYEPDLLGIPKETVTERDVFCYVESVSRSEFHEAGRNGIKPSLMFKVFAGDYNGEQTVRYKGMAYTVYRSYESGGNNIELYVQRKGGTNVKNTN